MIDKKIVLASLAGFALLGMACGTNDDDPPSGVSGNAGSSGGADKVGKGGSGGSTASGGSTSTAGSGGANQAGSGGVAHGGAGQAGSSGGSTSQGGASDGSCDSIYLIDAPGAGDPSNPGDTTLWRYKPDAADLKKSSLAQVGKIECPDTKPFFEIPFSMAVDGAGTAWVIYANFTDSIPLKEKLYKVDTATAKCSSTTYVTKQDVVRAPYTLTFVKPSASSVEEVLYATSLSSGGPLGNFDLSKLELTATSTKFDTGVQISGNNQGKLFGFFRGGVKEIAEIELATGKPMTPTPIPGIEFFGYRSWPIAGLASFGGSNWLFAADFSKKTTHVYQVAATGKVSNADLADRNIISASASTCAPSAAF